MLHLPRKHTYGLALYALMACSALSAAEVDTHVTGVRFWTQGDITRIAVETDGDFRTRSNRLHDPERLFFDFIGAQPALGKGVSVIPVSDKLVRQIRVAQSQHGVTRVVLDTQVPVDFTTSRLDNPSRLMIEVRAQGTQASSSKADPLKAEPVKREKIKPEPEAPKAIPAVKTEEPKPELKPFHAPILPSTLENAAKRPQFAMTDPPALVQPQTFGPSLAASMTPRIIATPPPIPVPLKTVATLVQPATVQPGTVLPAANVTSPRTDVALPAKRNVSGDRSMIRVLGLKVGRIVIDAGHGGHDVGTTGPSGLHEKDLVLDVARRLGKLVEERMGSEVIYTRPDDTFIPLERRTEIANEAKADLFLSIHANSSPIAAASGVETYYLNFTTSRSALEVAARENSGAQKSVFELQDILQKIALKDKVEESREFAARIESALVPISVKSNQQAKDRGVKKAPFVVLIGANMPSVLAEIGFISNEHDEINMKRPEYRQRIAEALFKGLANYANTLSHFQVAQRE